MQIGDLSRRTGVNERLLRYYEEQGLLSPSRSSAGYREYSEADVTTVAHIRCLLTAGLTTAVIADVLPCVGGGERMVPNCPELGDMLRRERARITTAIDELEASKRLLDEVLAASPVPV